MTDKQAFERVMELMGMKPLDAVVTEKGVIIEYQDTGKPLDNFDCCGYDEFYAGAIFDDSGNVVKGYIDSHVAHASKVCREFQQLKKAAQEEN